MVSNLAQSAKEHQKKTKKNCKLASHGFSLVCTNVDQLPDVRAAGVVARLPKNAKHGKENL